MGYCIKRIDSSQIGSLRELTRLVWGTISPTSATLEAKFLTKPFGAEYIGYIAYPDQEELTSDGVIIPAAFYGVFPILASYCGVAILCAQSGDTMTHPAHRGKGLFIELAKKTYQTARDEGVEFVFGFPSASSYPGFVRKLDWKFPHKMIRFSSFIPTFPLGVILRRLGLPSHGFGYFRLLITKLLFRVVTPDKHPWIVAENLQVPRIIRDSRLWSYKATNTLFIQFGGVGVVLKYDGDISIGEIVGSPSVIEMKSIIKRLQLLALVTGVVRIKSFFSPGSQMGILLAPHGNCSESLPYGFVNFSCKFDPALLELVFLDYDTF